jgi:signal transduction histidine kinase
MAPGTPRNLVWRLYAIGFVQLVVLAMAVFWVGHLLRPHIPHPAPPPGMLAPPPRDGREARDGHDPHEGRPPLRIWPPLLTFLVSGLVIVGVGSVATARSIVRPLETLSRTARAFGQGDLGARTGTTEAGEIGEVGRAFDEMADRVQSLLIAERELLANVSHELRTPLARIRVALEIAGETAPASLGASLPEIQSDLAELETLIDDVLTTTRLAIEDARAPLAGFELHLQELPVATLCDRAAERFRSRAPGRTLRVMVEEGLPPLHVDPVLFRRVLDNLLENAHKYSPDPATPIVLRAGARDAGASGAVASGTVLFEVADEGIGVRPEDLPHLFAPFFRGERSRSRGTGGVGLGLTLARRIVEAHGGTIDVRSPGGAGTTVRVRVPLHDASGAVP